MQSRESRKYIIFCSKLSNGKVAIVWKTLTVLNANARSALGAPGQTAAFRIAVRLLSAGVQQRSERSLGAQFQFLGLQSWSSGVQSECSSGICGCNLSAILMFWSAILAQPWCLRVQSERSTRVCARVCVGEGSWSPQGDAKFL